MIWKTNRCVKGLAILSLLLLFVATAVAQPDPCLINPGDYRTQTQGGWGANCHGGNPGCILQNNFSAVFPSGITVGGIYTMHFSSAAAVANYLPSTATANTLTGNLVDPVTTPSGVFGGQVLTLKINVAFSDAAVSGFPSGLGYLKVQYGVYSATGEFAGWSVYQILNLANQVLGGNTAALPVGISISDLNDVVDAINNNFDNGTINLGYLIREDCGDEPLPVELTAFDATANDHAILINWRTASESSIARYEVKRNDGSGDWSTLTNIAGLGDSPIGHSYSFTDNNVTAGTTYLYRLIIHEVDGSTVVHSQIASASLQTVSSPQEFALYQNYPNPFNPTTMIAFNLGETSLVKLSVFDLLGREVAVLANSEMPAGAHSVMFNAAGLAGGSYFYRLEAGSFTAVRRLMLVK